MNTFLWLMAIFSGAVIVSVSLIFTDGIRQGFTVSEIVDVTSEPVKKVLEDPEDKTAREAISSSYCNVLRKRGEIKIDEFSECVTQYSLQPLDIYKAFTREEITQAWTSLSMSEKHLVVAEVKKAEEGIIANIEMEAMIEASRKAMENMTIEDYLGTQ